MRTENSKAQKEKGTKYAMKRIERFAPFRKYGAHNFLPEKGNGLTLYIEILRHKVRRLGSYRKINKVYAAMNSLPEITKVEAQLQRLNEYTFRTQLSREALQNHKIKDQQAHHDQKEESLRLVRENGLLRQEVAQYKSSMQAMVIFWEKMTLSFEQQKDAFQELSTRIALTESNILRQHGLENEEDVVLI